MDVNILFMMVLATLIPDTRDLKEDIRPKRALPDIWDEGGCQDCQDTARVRGHVHWTRDSHGTRVIWVPDD